MAGPTARQGRHGVGPAVHHFGVADAMACIIARLARGCKERLRVSLDRTEVRDFHSSWPPLVSGRTSRGKDPVT
jgi:hypothetical protein